MRENQERGNLKSVLFILGLLIILIALNLVCLDNIRKTDTRVVSSIPVGSVKLMNRSSVITDKLFAETNLNKGIKEVFQVGEDLKLVKRVNSNISICNVSNICVNVINYQHILEGYNGKPYRQ